jgi:hypothetical protein
MAEVIAAAMAGFEPWSAHSVVHVACSSPSAVHRLPTLTALLVGAWANPPVGIREATAEDLSGWLIAPALASDGYLEAEDWVPADPRSEVRTEWSGVVWPLHPGWLDQPWETLELVRRLAEAVDPVLERELGFGIGDVAELALRISGLERVFLGPIGRWSPPGKSARSRQ